MLAKNDEISGGKLATDNKNEYVSLSIELQGMCVPFNVMLRPYAMFIHGQIYSGITERREFMFINNSISSIKFNWELFNNEFFILEVEPANATLDPNQEMQLQLCVTGCCPGPINHQLRCYLEYQDEPIYYNVQVDIKGADVAIEEPNVDFGLVCRGECVTREITLNNKSPIQAQFSVQEEIKSNSDLTELKIFPENGTLQPLESCKVSISYNAQNLLPFTKYISVQIIGGEKRNVLVYGEVQNPQVVLESCQLHMEGLYHNVPGTYQVVLINNTLLQTNFEWQQAFGSQAKFCDIEIVPQSGYIGPREKKTMDLIFTAYNKVLFYDIYISCQIYGMETQPCLSLSGDVLGVNVEYRISLEDSLPPEQSNEAEKVLNFGEGVLINSLSHGYIHILNHSAIDTTFKAYIEHFPARLPSPPVTDEKYKNCHSRRDSIWKKLNHIKPPGTFLTSIDTEEKNSYLRDNNGAAFLITPKSGSLSAYGSVVIQVSAIHNMWGQYSDTFCCQVGELEMVKIPIILNVVGAPLKFLMMGRNTDQAPKLRFGSEVAGNDSTDRKLRICNTSPFDIRVDWLGYNIYDDDDKLLDFKVIYGDAFPILGEDGLEVCPSAPESLPEQSSSESVETVQKQRNDAIFGSENFIKAIVNIHSGTQSDKPFTIIPKQMVIPANSDETYVTVRFSPPLAQEVTHEFNCVSFGLGYLNLCNHEENDKSSTISRPQGYDIAPLTIHMTAHVLPAQLYVDFMGEDQLYFECNLCQLLENNKLCEKKMMTSSLKLINLTQTSMNFMLLTKEPFTFTNLQLSSLDNTNEKHSTFFTLYPQKHLMVKVGFLLSSEILSYRQMLEAEDTCLLDGVSLKTVGKEMWMQFTNAITIKFRNETTQTITTEAKVALPDFDVSTDKIDFGICWIGQEKWEEFTLINTSQSKSLFFISIDVSCSCCDTKTFYTEPSSGYLEGHVTHADAYWTKIKIFFAAKKVGGHQAKLNISGIMGEKQQQINVKGYGSHDGRHCSVIEG
ncbi:unnamed protein product [Acanthosepion pharaonis]|uniref:HYDIN/VesB/CFA65-like Ig-like domain-containing protein n=1 Tax=Acanthosepion pharaonis TaxID=158019 RepID=A0A812AHH1_ACAPH|nr:unnamed protein product [Sepia pharaonis]